MVYYSLPDEQPAATHPRGVSGNAIFFSETSGKHHCPRHETPHLLVANFQNAGRYVLNNRPVSVSDNYFYLLNAGDRLEIDFREKTRLQTFLVLFDQSFIKQVFYFLSTPAHRLLENPVMDYARDLHIPAVPFAMNTTLRQQLYSLIVHHPDRNNTENILFNMLSIFYLMLQDTDLRLQKIQAVKSSTKEELYRRLFTAERFMHNHLSDELPIERIASAACLNKFHFITLFRDLYHTTPHQYLTELRLEKAYEQLKYGRYTVTDACYGSGFKSPASFSHLFKKKYGHPPSALIK
jgi:AraC-like DNA-binding protein